MNTSGNEPGSLSLPRGAVNDGPKGLKLRPGQTLCGDLDLRIDGGGTWYYAGSPIGRKELVRLFASVLRRDQAGDYWLVTPAEVGRIDVEDAPFLAVEMAATGQGRDQILQFRTNIGASVTAGADHPIRVDINPDTDEPSPYIVLDGDIEARIARAVYYDLVALGGHEADQDGDAAFGVWSEGHFFVLGHVEADA